MPSLANFMPLSIAPSVDARSVSSDSATRASQPDRTSVVDFDVVPLERFMLHAGFDIGCVPNELFQEESYDVPRTRRRAISAHACCSDLTGHREYGSNVTPPQSPDVHINYSRDIDKNYSREPRASFRGETIHSHRRDSLASDCQSQSPPVTPVSERLKQAIRDVIRAELRTLKEDMRHIIEDVLTPHLDSDGPRHRMSASSHAEYAVSSKRVEARKSFKEFGPEESDGLKAEVLFNAVSDGDIDAVMGFLDVDADPNSVMPSYSRHGSSSREYTDCSLLAVAVMSNNVGMARLLVERGADPISSRYSFLAGSLMMPWSASAIFAALPGGNLDMVRELVELKANPHDVSSNNANLVWQSCYFGHAHILSYLLQLGIEFDIAGKSQDFEGIFHTPLHIAAIHNQDIALQKLISAKAEIDKVNEDHKTPLLYAIQLGRISAIRILVANGANLFHNDFKLKRVHGRPVDQLFEMSNPVLVKSAALGLQEREEQVKFGSSDDLLRFLQCSIAKAEFLRAVFKRRTFRYWNADEGNMEVKTAAMRKPLLLHGGYKYRFLNVTTSKHTHASMEAMVKKRLEPDRYTMHFIKDLAPQDMKPAWSCCFGYWNAMAAIHTYEALIPDFHEDLRILEAIASSSAYDEVFNGEPCQAILHHAWKDVWLYSIWRVATDIFLMAIFVALALRVSTEGDCWFSKLEAVKCSMYEFEGEVQALAIAGIPVWVFQVLAELCIFSAHIRNGWLRKYISSVWRISVPLSDGFILWSVFLMRGRATQDSTYSFIFAVLVVLKWAVVVYRLTPLRQFGLHVMPILFTLTDVGPFAMIFATCVMAFTTGYIALDIGSENWRNSLMNVFLFGSFGEPQFLPDYTEFYDTTELRIIFAASTFATCITMMNCFIAAMSTSYRIGNANQHRLYQSRLAGEVWKSVAIRQSIQCCRHRLAASCCLKRFCLCLQGCRSVDDHVVNKNYLWFASSIEE